MNDTLARLEPVLLQIWDGVISYLGQPWFAYQVAIVIALFLLAKLLARYIVPRLEAKARTKDRCFNPPFSVCGEVCSGAASEQPERQRGARTNDVGGVQGSGWRADTRARTTPTSAVTENGAGEHPSRKWRLIRRTEAAARGEQTIRAGPESRQAMTGGKDERECAR